MIKELQDRKGELSRKIGEAKRGGVPFDDLIAQMREVSRQLKELEDASSKSSPKNAIQQPKDEPVPDMFSFLPAQGDVLGLKVVEASQSDSDRWDNFVASCPQASPYHHWEFKEIIQNTFGHRAHYFMVVHDENGVQGVLPAVELKSHLFGHFMASMPFFNYGGALVKSQAAQELLLKAVIEKASTLGVGHVELRACAPIEGLVSKTSKVSMIRALPKSQEQLWDDIGTKVRAQIKKAQRFHLSFRQGGLELLDDFYRVFAENMRDLGTPVYSKAFFEDILTKVHMCQATIGVLYDGDKPVSCCFLIGYKEMLEIPWASTLKSANALNANMLLYWHVLAYAVSHGYRFFDFGRSTADAPTFKFKKQWGAAPKQQYWEYWLRDGGDLPELNPDNPKYRLMIAVWQRLPVWLTRLIGPPVVKYLP